MSEYDRKTLMLIVIIILLAGVVVALNACTTQPMPHDNIVYKYRPELPRGE